MLLHWTLVWAWKKNTHFPKFILFFSYLSSIPGLEVCLVMVCCLLFQHWCISTFFRFLFSVFYSFHIGWEIEFPNVHYSLFMHRETKLYDNVSVWIFIKREKERHIHRIKCICYRVSLLHQFMLWIVIGGPMRGKLGYGTYNNDCVYLYQY